MFAEVAYYERLPFSYYISRFRFIYPHVLFFQEKSEKDKMIPHEEPSY